MGRPRINPIQKSVDSPQARKIEVKLCTCPICEKQMAETVIRAHVVRVHKLKCYQCKICNKDIQTSKLLAKHYRIVHDGEKAFTCELCGSKFSTPFSYRMHKKLHTGEKRHQCCICNKKYVLRSQLNRHLKRHNISKSMEKSCKVNRKKFTAENDKFKCDTCGKGFRYRSSFKYHLRIHTGEKPHQCELCGKCFNTPSLFNRHLEIHRAKKSYICEKCGKLFPGPIHLQSHINKYHLSNCQNMKCPDCGKILHGSSSYKYHTESKTCQKRFKCSLCNNAYSKNSDLQKHLEMHSNNSTSKWYECDVCSKVFNKRSNLRIHQKIHNQDKPFRCQICDKSFINKPKLLRHQSIHSKSKGSEEELADYSTEQTAAMDMLASVKYLDLQLGSKTKPVDSGVFAKLIVNNKMPDGDGSVPPFPVDFVTQPEDSAIDDKIHVDLDDDVEEFLQEVLQKHKEAGKTFTSISGKPDLKAFNCNICGKVLHGLSSFKYHMDSKTCQKRFVCPVCNMKYNKEMDLKKHMELHSNTKMFECELCNKVFKKRDYLCSHQKIHSKNKDFTCLVCGKGFIYKSKLLRHSTVHKSSRNVNKTLNKQASEKNDVKVKYATIESKDTPQNTSSFVHVNGGNGQIQKEKDMSQLANTDDVIVRKTVLVSKHEPIRDTDRELPEAHASNTFENVSRMSADSTAIISSADKTGSDSSHLKCETCGKRFRTVSCFQRHVSLKTCPKNFCCVHCDKAYSSLSDLSNHCETHSKKCGLKIIQCDVCQKVFKDEKKLLSHYVKHSHKSFECEGCGKSFQSNEQLAVHLSAHPTDDSISNISADQNCYKGSEIQEAAILHRNAEKLSSDVQNETVCNPKDISQKFPLSDSDIMSSGVRCIENVKDNLTVHGYEKSCSKVKSQAFQNGKKVSLTEHASATVDGVASNQDVFQNSTLKNVSIVNDHSLINLEIQGEIHSQNDCEGSPREVETLSNGSGDTVPYDPEDTLQIDDEHVYPVPQEEQLPQNSVGRVLRSRKTKRQISAKHNIQNCYKNCNDHYLQKAKARCKRKEIRNEKKTIRAVKGPVVCDICGKTLSSVSSLAIHIQRHTSSKMYMCEICGKQFKDKVYHKEHVLTHTGDSDYKCTTCGMAFISERKLVIHTRKHTGEKPFMCEICGKAHDDQARLKSHLLTHANDEEKPHKCPHCKKGFVAKTKLERHIRTHTGERPFKCHLCQKGFLDKSDLNSHINSHKQEKTYKCDICDKFLKTKSSYRLHVENHSGVKAHMCELCGRGFQFSSNLKRHKRTHTGEKTIQCQDCGMMFSEKSRLLSHSVIHQEDRPHKCDKCGKTFKRLFGLKSHIENQHRVSEKFKCDQCSECFPGAGELRQHARNQHSSGFPYHCAVCGKGFDKKNNCKTHTMLVHTKERPFKCKICNKGFINSSKLERHNITHTQLKPFKCESCGNAFNVLSNLQSHVKKHHPNYIQSRSSNPPAIQTLNQHQGQNGNAHKPSDLVNSQSGCLNINYNHHVAVSRTENLVNKPENLESISRPGEYFDQSGQEFANRGQVTIVGSQRINDRDPSTEAVNNIDYNHVTQQSNVQITHSEINHFNEANIVMYNQPILDHSTSQFLYVDLQNAIGETTVTL